MTTDPTAIPIEFDPREQRMRGTAVHGNTPFDVPYVSHIIGDLYQGGCRNELFVPPHIRHVVSLYPWEAYTAKRDQLDSVMAVRMYDSLEGPDEEQVVQIARWVNQCLKTGPTLVHCQAGLNRSGLVTAVAIMLDRPWSAAKTIEHLRATRSPAVLCNPVFEQWLYDFEASEVAA